MQKIVTISLRSLPFNRLNIPILFTPSPQQHLVQFELIALFWTLSNTLSSFLKRSASNWVQYEALPDNSTKSLM